MFQTAKRLIEEKEEKRNASNKKKVLPSEVNFLVLPFFSLSRGDHEKEGLEYKKVVERDGKREEVVWKVSPSNQYGYPGIYDKKIFKAVEELLGDRGYPIDNPVTFSVYELLKLMGKDSIGGRDYRQVRESMERLVATTIKSKGTFYHKGKKQYLDEVFHLFSRVIFTGEKLPGGEEAEENHLYLNSWLLDNLNQYYIRPLDYNFYRSLKSGISKRLYELLGVKFFGLLETDRPFLRYQYKTICKLLPIKKQNYPSKAKQILEPAHQELTKENFLELATWNEKTGKTFIRYYPGRKAKSESK